MPTSTSAHLHFPIPGATASDKRLVDIQAIKNALAAIDVALNNLSGVSVELVTTQVIDNIFNSPVTLTIVGSEEISSEFPNIYTVTLTQLASTETIPLPIKTVRAGATIVDGNTLVVDPSLENGTAIGLTTEFIYNGKLVVGNLIVTVANSGAALSPTVVAPYYGVATVPGSLDGVFVKSLTQRGNVGNRGISHATFDSGVDQMYWYAYPATMGLATFTDLNSGFEGGWDGATGTGPATVNVDGINYYIYRSDNSNLGVSDYSVS